MTTRFSTSVAVAGSSTRASQREENSARESAEENLKLAKLCTKGRLAFLATPCDLPSRVLNAFKNQDVDCQIGDRRWSNRAEGSTSYLSLRVASLSVITIGRELFLESFAGFFAVVDFPVDWDEKTYLDEPGGC